MNEHLDRLFNSYRERGARDEAIGFLAALRAVKQISAGEHDAYSASVASWRPTPAS